MSGPTTRRSNPARRPVAFRDANQAVHCGTMPRRSKQEPLPMCGRYVIAGTTELSERFQLRQIPAELFPTWNAAPSQELPVIVGRPDGGVEVRFMQWGLLPRWRREGQRSLAPINARAETLLEKPMFRGLVPGQRCIVPVDGFFEWRALDGRKQPYYITSRDGALWGLAGLYDESPGPHGEPVASYTIITTAANDMLRPLHERMPVILRRDDEAEWLDRAETDPRAVEQLLLPYPDDRIELWPVSTAVNNVRNNAPELIRPAERQPGLLDG
ncbi:MAG: SOS response-associated peptidase [Thermomicrobiales bacterium]|nr:SOS response-associated peptidase [Thermomicrobiales bacterium]